ncbi:hypothetical protein Q8F55_001302 [Vanrija albida]|uniref:Uncharacterized protein n=1 Tax=Vanrija albida TaxID=181172 RepID=A0ABR3QFN1_9TREE
MAAPPAYHDVVGGSAPPIAEASSSASPFRRRKVASITLHDNDRMYILGFPPELMKMLEKLIHSEWRVGIQKVTVLKSGGSEYKFKGEPWDVRDRRDGIPACRLMMRILSALALEGWGLVLSTGFQHSPHNNDTLFFREGPRLERTFFVISFPRSDRIRIIDAPRHVEDQFISVFRSWWSGVQNREELGRGVYEFQLKGKPFGQSAKDNIPIRLMMSELLEVLDGLGYEVFANVGMDYGDSHSREERRNWTSVDTWFLTDRRE